MHRRSLLAALASFPAGAALAEHGWEPFDGVRPIYLEGRVTTIIWADPHAHLEMLHQPGSATLRGHLRRRQMPGGKENAEFAALLDKAIVPSESGEIWRVELPSLAKLGKWGVPRPKIKQLISLIGYLGPQLLDTKTVRAEYFVVEGEIYPLRSETT